MAVGEGAPSLSGEAGIAPNLGSAGLLGALGDGYPPVCFQC